MPVGSDGSPLAIVSADTLVDDPPRVGVLVAHEDVAPDMSSSSGCWLLLPQASERTPRTPPQQPNQVLAFLCGQSSRRVRGWSRLTHGHRLQSRAIATPHLPACRAEVAPKGRGGPHDERPPPLGCATEGAAVTIELACPDPAWPVRWRAGSNSVAQGTEPIGDVWAPSGEPHVDRGCAPSFRRGHRC